MMTSLSQKKSGECLDQEDEPTGTLPQTTGESSTNMKEQKRVRRKSKKKKAKKRKGKQTVNNEADSDVGKDSPPMYTVDGEKFFHSRAELERHLSGKYRKKISPKRRRGKRDSIQKKTESIEAAGTAPLGLDPVASTEETSDAISPALRLSRPFLPQLTPSPEKRSQRPPRPLTPCNPEKDLGGEFAPLFFDKTDEWERQEEAFACAQDEKVSDELLIVAATGSQQQRFTTDNINFFPSMGALRKFYAEVEKENCQH